MIAIYEYIIENDGLMGGLIGSFIGVLLFLILYFRDKKILIRGNRPVITTSMIKFENAEERIENKDYLHFHFTDLHMDSNDSYLILQFTNNGYEAIINTNTISIDAKYKKGKNPGHIRFKNKTNQIYLKEDSGFLFIFDLPLVNFNKIEFLCEDKYGTKYHFILYYTADGLNSSMKRIGKISEILYRYKLNNKTKEYNGVLDEFYKNIRRRGNYPEINEFIEKLIDTPSLINTDEMDLFNTFKSNERLEYLSLILDIEGNYDESKINKYTTNYLQKSKMLIIHLECKSKTSLYFIDSLVNRIKNHFPDEINVIFGLTINDEMIMPTIRMVF